MSQSSKRKRTSTLTPPAAVDVGASTSASAGPDAATIAVTARVLTPTSSSNPASSSSQAHTPVVDCPFNIEFRQGRTGRYCAKPAASAIDVRRPPEDSNTVYIVRPEKKWKALKRYRDFTVGEEHFVPGDFVYINNESIPHGTELTSVDESKFWIARILEIKASDEFHVYLRIYWMYRPGDLKGGKQWHHGANEVVNSNHMDVVDAMTVIGKAQVGHWLEMDDDEELPMLYWRQIYDYMSKTVGEVRRHCRCDRYYNPDRKMYGCGNPACGKWLHEECLIEEVKKRVMERGGGPPPRTEYKMDVDITEGGGGLVKVAPKRKGGGTGVGVGLTVPALRTAAVPEMPKKNTHIAAGAVHAKNGKRKTKKEILAELEKIQVTFVDGKKVMAHVRDIRGVSATVGNKNHEHEHAEYKIQEWDETVDCLACGTTLE